MIQTTGNIISVILVFGGLIFFHELGHYLVARSFSIGVKTFSLGFGPRIFSFKKGKTVYQLAAIPLGGFVSIVGESASAEIPEPFTKEESFALRPAWQRFCVIVAGSLFNFLLAFLILWGLIFVQGKVEANTIIAKVHEDTPAATAGLLEGDRILEVNGTKVVRFSQVLFLLYQNGENPVSIKLERDAGNIIEVQMQPKQVTETLPDGTVAQRWIVGVSSAVPKVIHLSFFASSLAAVESATQMVTSTWDGIKGLVSKKIGLESVSGPVGITQMIYKQADEGLAPLLLLTALISVNLGILNLLPIPVLDGGHLLFISLEMIFRRPVPLFIQEKAMYIGLALLLALMVFATFNDVTRKTSEPSKKTEQSATPAESEKPLEIKNGADGAAPVMQNSEPQPAEQ